MFSRIITTHLVEKIVVNTTGLTRTFSTHSVFDIQDVLQEKSQEKNPRMDVVFGTDNTMINSNYDRFSGNYQKILSAEDKTLDNNRDKK